ncbi:MAG: type II secretion system protein [Phycisphaerales bacterium]|jgi:prepilin-type N-terminal cleavage/methylation domain-containing protein
MSQALRCPRVRGFTMLEVMIAIGILAVLSAALITFTFGLAGRRDRLVREGERSAMLARVLDRVERLAATASHHARHGEDFFELRGRGIWPAAGRSGVPAGASDVTGRLSFSEDAEEITWRETSGSESVELVVTDVEAVYVDHFEELVTASGSRPPLRLCIWLAPVDRQRQVDPEEELDERFAPERSLFDEPELPERPADVVFVVGDPLGKSLGGTQPSPPDDPMGMAP